MRLEFQRPAVTPPGNGSKALVCRTCQETREPRPKSDLGAGPREPSSKRTQQPKGSAQSTREAPKNRLTKKKAPAGGPRGLPMPLLLSKGALAIAAVVGVALNARGGPIRSKTLARRLALPERHLEPMLQAMARHGILKSTRGPLGGYELAREQRRITADEILRAAGTADKTDRTPVPQSALLNSVVMPAVEQAERTFSTALTRINIEDLAHSAAALPTQEPDRTDSILTEPDSVRQSRARDRRVALKRSGDS
jgi:Rrf2 family iron-sulfur cluster assembly transcriptional regulator